MVGFRIDEFSSHIVSAGTLQTNKYFVEIAAPDGLPSSLFDFGGIARKLAFRAETVRLPGAFFDIITNREHGNGTSQKFPTNVNFNDLPISFIDDGNNSIYKHFYNWLNLIFGFSTKGRRTNEIEYKKNYVVDIIVRVFDNAGYLITSAVFKEAYPIALNDINLSWSDNNNLLRNNVTFSFTDWYLQTGFLDTSVLANLFSSPADSQPSAENNSADKFQPVRTEIILEEPLIDPRLDAKKYVNS